MIFLYFPLNRNLDTWYILRSYAMHEPFVCMLSFSVVGTPATWETVPWVHSGIRCVDNNPSRVKNPMFSKKCPLVQCQPTLIGPSTGFPLIEPGLVRIHWLQHGNYTINNPNYSQRYGHSLQVLMMSLAKPAGMLCFINLVQQSTRM